MVIDPQFVGRLFDPFFEIFGIDSNRRYAIAPRQLTIPDDVRCDQAKIFVLLDHAFAIS
ncbi:hypothetical protein DSM3645_11407 [Blastopirellula marina DSM 3645]|uniref:Uncharacterized protein n=1 Tax=Blastopirellula marina DSM 3645 TaxID=314230 RepID=A3ZT23_9BACT|nr:hypothetical protein DSM3645_11407 [Blastopirellula marina DSM 3645]